MTVYCSVLLPCVWYPELLEQFPWRDAELSDAAAGLRIKNSRLKPSGVNEGDLSKS